ncbi:DUF6249 domain-containing protein [Polaribacter cellanae]|uniref:DUF6249 domain-containing protein n=1 Tax=Polaribacter cellanae TaxID=2818493 RepID=A0A975H8A5_9FLAO|nr:DUF6249 domain-containing protein [Polaribacter cellanae]QTE23834.1 hypothetical protein J3359_06085 [Polaribacter cellanae]
MGPEIVFIFLFAVIFGVFYLYFSTRNKERLALIEKGADASIFITARNRKAAPFWKVLILNLGLLAMGIGVGVLLGALLSYNFGYTGGYQNRPSNYIQTETFYLASIFLCAGASLLIGFNITKNLDKE